MSERLSTESYKGVRDFYPEEWAMLTTAFTNMRETLGRFGYEEYHASPLEHTALYESKGNEEIINEQTYTFTDRGDRRVTLRPEMTPTVARMVAARRREMAFPLRWFSIPNVFRYERPQKGRLREHYQVNADLIGLPEGEADLEILSVLHDIFIALGATEKDFVIRINSRTLLQAAITAAGYEDESGMREYLRLLDKKNKMTVVAFQEALGGRPDPLQVVEEAADTRVREEKEKILTMISTLSERGITNVEFNPEIARGFDYYTGLVFEVFDTSPENPKALAGGGRYDELVSGLFGGDSVPMVGFGLGDVTLLDFLEEHGLVPKRMNAPQVYIATPSPSDRAAAQLLAPTLRAHGLRVFVNLSEKKLGDQFKDADKRNIPLVLTYGEQERTNGTYKVKVLATTKEHETTADTLVATIESLLG